MTQRTVLIAADTLDRLAPHAARRGISIPELVRRIVDAAADDGLVDSILDDIPVTHEQIQPKRKVPA